VLLNRPTLAGLETGLEVFVSLPTPGERPLLCSSSQTGGTAGAAAGTAAGCRLVDDELYHYMINQSINQLINQSINQ